MSVCRPCLPPVSFVPQLLFPTTIFSCIDPASTHSHTLSLISYFVIPPILHYPYPVRCSESGHLTMEFLPLSAGRVLRGAGDPDKFWADPAWPTPSLRRRAGASSGPPDVLRPIVWVRGRRRSVRHDPSGLNGGQASCPQEAGCPGGSGGGRGRGRSMKNVPLALYRADIGC
jgi:hypothetical protein